MILYIRNRLLKLIPVLLGITLLTFLLVHSSSSDTVDVMESQRGSAMSEEEKASERAKLGLDKSLPEQYGRWLLDILHGDMGTSYVSGKPVAESFAAKLPVTLLLTGGSVLLTLCLSVPLGILAAVRRETFLDYLIRILGFLGNSLPNFFAAFLLLYFLAIKWKQFPVIASAGTGKGMVLPILTLGLAMTSKYIRQVRAAVLEELAQDYVQGAMALGIRKNRILFVGVLKSSMQTILSLLSLSVGSLLGGTAIVESIFQLDGIGNMAVDAITMKDIPVIQTYVIWMAVNYVILNLLTDLMHAALDPRVRLGGTGG